MDQGRHMAEEIAEQPAVIERLLRDGGAQIRSVAAALRRHDLRFVLFAARGTSDHAALYGKYLAEIELGMPAGLASPSTGTVYGARPDLRGVLFVTVSQSGGSPDLLDALAVARSCGAVTLAITNNPDSELARAAEHSIYVHAGVERAVAATKSYVAELLALWLLVAALRDHPADAAAPLAEAAQRTLGSAEVIEAAAARYRFADRMITTARGYSYPSAREGALKLMETSYLGAQAFSGADLLHGPMAMVDARTPVIAVVTPGRGGQAMAPVLEALRARRADLLIVGAGGDDAPGLPVYTDGIAESLHPVLEIMPMQQLALELALHRGENPDAPRGLSKVTQTW
jgi:glucosamine--fructose-6-phosphate aminotransferase (isomerizing)